MSISKKDREILRGLAKRVAEIAALPEQAEKIRLWKACNDLKPERAMVLAIQQPWNEMADAWMTTECESEEVRSIEWSLRAAIVQHEHIPDDLPILDTWEVNIPAYGGGYDDYGFKLLTTHSGEQRGAYHIEPVIKCLEDMEPLHFRPITLDHAAADKQFDFYNDLFGDIMKVRKVGRLGWRYGLSRVLIHMIGLENMMLYMYDKPELLHKLMGFLRDDYMNELDILERENAIGYNNTPRANLGSGGLAYNSNLPIDGDDPCRAPLTDCWCWAESQETVGVGPKQFDEFVLDYQIPLMNRFGMVDYGCCEPLDHKLDILLKKVPHVRWLAVSPWSDRKLCAEKMGDKYVYVYKPNPSRICAPVAEWDAAEQDVCETLEIARGCPIHIVMKDTSTFHGEAERTTQWCKMAKRLAIEAAS